MCRSSSGHHQNKKGRRSRRSVLFFLWSLHLSLPKRSQNERKVKRTDVMYSLIKSLNFKAATEKQQLFLVIEIIADARQEKHMGLSTK